MKTETETIGRSRAVKTILKIAAVAAAAVLVLALALNLYVCGSTKDRIISLEDVSELTDIDLIIVLGAKVNRGGVPSHMLEDRILQGIAVYEAGVCGTLLMSGDSQSDDYDETTVMRKYAEEKGVPAEDILTDRYGISTYDSIYRLKSVYGAKKVIVITQEYHLYRALYIMNALGIEGFGVSADLRPYASQIKQDARETLARVKEFFKVWFMPDAVYSDRR